MPFGTIGLKNAEGEELPLLETGPSEPSFLIKQDSPTFFSGIPNQGDIPLISNP